MSDVVGEGHNGDGLAARYAVSDRPSPARAKAARKRGLPVTDEPTGTVDSSTSADDRAGPAKRTKVTDAEGSLAYQVRVPVDRSAALPHAVWHHVFTFLPPRSLGNLLRVNKLFNACLDPASSAVVEKPSPPPARSIVVAMEPNDIWRSSRRSFWPNMPGPLKDKTELDMWRLACSSTCQFCGKRDPRRPRPTDPSSLGPGVDGVTPIWHFGVRCCGSCLTSKSVKEMDFLLSEASTFLIPALQFVFVTSDASVVPFSAIERGLLGPSTSLTKLYWVADVKALREEFASVKELGAAAVEEWQKGLSSRGSNQRTGIAKWEKYAESRGVTNMRMLLYPGYRPKQLTSPLPSSSESREKEATTTVASQPPMRDTVKDLAAGEMTRKSTLPNMITEGCDASNTAPAMSSAAARALRQPAGKTEKTKEEIDAEWDEAQGFVRFKILKYADEAIIGDWDDGEKVTKDNAPSFAADVLLHVRKRFYAEIEKEAKVLRAAGRVPVVDPPGGPFTQKLSLENMKYVFDIKIKPLSGNLRKELFLCHDCDYNDKYFTFEGVIQHFAAKHTEALSLGNIVVNWRAEWPEHAPFKPNPRSSKSGIHPQSSLPLKPRAAKQASARPDHGHGQFPGKKPSGGLPPPPSLPSMPPVPLQQAPLPQLPHIGGKAGHAYSNSPFPHGGMPQPTPTPTGPPYSRTGPYGSEQPDFQPPVYPQQPSSAPYPPYAMNNASYFPAEPNAALQTYVSPGAMASSQTPPLLPQPSMLPASNRSGGFVAVRPSAGGGESAEEPYQTQLEEVALHARGLWKATKAMFRLPGVVRIYTIVYHLDRFFQNRFRKRLPLELFIDGLSNMKEMRPVRNLNELPCKTCFLGLDKAPTSQEERRLFSFPQLVNHFYTRHANSQNGLNWMTDMLLLPQPSALSDMIGPQGKAFPLLSEAVGELLAWPEEALATHELPPSNANIRGRGDISSTGPNAGRPTSANGSHGARMQRKKSGNDEDKGSSWNVKDNSSTSNRGSQRKHLPRRDDARTGSGDDVERRRENAIQNMWTADRQLKRTIEPPHKVYRKTQHAHLANSERTKIKTEQTDDMQSFVGSREHLNHADTLRQHDHKDRFMKREPEAQVSRGGYEGLPAYGTAGTAADAPDLLDALEMHLNEPVTARHHSPIDVPAPRDVPRVVYVDEHGRRVPSPRGVYDMYPSHADGEPGRIHGRPAVYNTAPRGQAVQYRERSPLPGHHPAEEPVYTACGGGYGGAHGEARVVARQAQTYRDAAHGRDRSAEHTMYVDENGRAVRAPRTFAYGPYEEEYEVVRVVHPDGDYYARRPVRHEARPAEYYDKDDRRMYRSAMTAATSYEDRDGRMGARRRDYVEYAAGEYAERSLRARGMHDSTVTAAGRYAEKARQEANPAYEEGYESEYDPRHPTRGGVGAAAAAGRALR